MADSLNAKTSRLEVTVGHSPLAFVYSLFIPTIAINGERHPKPWGVHSFELAPGDYEIAVSYPWLFLPECGRACVLVSLTPGEIKKVSYRAGLIRYLPGKITVHS
jgi:hypothetical protein